MGCRNLNYLGNSKGLGSRRVGDQLRVRPHTRSKVLWWLICSVPMLNNGTGGDQVKGVLDSLGLVKQVSFFIMARHHLSH